MDKRLSTRRAVILAAAAWPALVWTRAVFAQSKQPILIGRLSTGSRESVARARTAFKEGMAALGWKEGSNYVLEERWADGRVDRLPSLAQELNARKPVLIVASPLTAVRAAAKASPDIPVVQAGGGASAVAVGLAKSLARPGGMVTGVTNIGAELSEKYLELLLATAPGLKRIGYLADPMTITYGSNLKNARRAAEHHRVEARIAEAAKAEELEAAISRLAKDGVEALVVLPSALFYVERARIVKLAMAHRWPVVAGASSYVEAGALLSYAVDTAALQHRVAYYVDRILKGAKPGDLPIEQPTRFELVVNLKTAKAIGLTISQSLLFRADKVIE